MFVFMEFILLCYDQQKMNIKLATHTGILFNLFNVCYLWSTFGTVLKVSEILCLRVSGGFSETLVDIYETAPSQYRVRQAYSSPLMLITFYE
jgi:hypothetical protein